MQLAIAQTEILFTQRLEECLELFVGLERVLRLQVDELLDRHLLHDKAFLGQTEDGMVGVNVGSRAILENRINCTVRMLKLLNQPGEY